VRVAAAVALVAKLVARSGCRPRRRARAGLRMEAPGDAL